MSIIMTGRCCLVKGLRENQSNPKIKVQPLYKLVFGIDMKITMKFGNLPHFQIAYLKSTTSIVQFVAERKSENIKISLTLKKTFV